jgi:hypothetical protein
MSIWQDKHHSAWPSVTYADLRHFGGRFWRQHSIILNRCPILAKSDVCQNMQSRVLFYPLINILISGDHTSNYRGCLKYKTLLKGRIETYSNHQIQNTILTFPILKSPHHFPKVSYASAVGPIFTNILLSNSFNNDKSFSDLSQNFQY